MHAAVKFRFQFYCGLIAACLSLLATAQTGPKPAATSAAKSNPFPPKGNLSTASRISLVFGDVQRYYLVQPATGTGLHPIVILLHGGTQTAEQVWSHTSLPTLAAQNNFVLVAPNGLNRHWNDGRGAVLSGKPSTADDIGFLQAVIRDVLRDHSGDPQSVFMVGVSNGGFMTTYFACSGAYPLRAAANAISDLVASQQQTCKAPLISWLSMNGTDDLVVPFAGMKQGTKVRGQAQPALVSADDTFHFFAQRAGCGNVLKGERLPHLNPSDPTYAERRTCTGRDGKVSVQYVFHGAGHALPNRRPDRQAQRAYGRSNQDVDAGQIIWDFFKSTM